MNWWQKESGYWMGWIAAGVVSMTCCVLLGVHLFATNTFCTGASDEQCLREWASALGGWVALPAAVITVIFLSRQVADAARQHNQTIALQLRRHQAIARKTRRSMVRLQRIVEHRRALWSNPFDDQKDLSEDYFNTIKLIKKIISGYEIATFENEIDVSPKYTKDELADIIEMSHEQSEIFKDMIWSEFKFPLIKNNMDSIIRHTEVYATSLLTVIDSFTDEVKRTLVS
ncbi:hypothetical protein F4V89_18295 [Neorhizobium galegae]|nr:hypothetical protein F4V89_18295 [Neorhizobium galegae]